MDIRKYIVPKLLNNTDNKGKKGNKNFQTEDFVYIDDIATYKKLGKFKNWVQCSSFARYNSIGSELPRKLRFRDAINNEYTLCLTEKETHYRYGKASIYDGTCLIRPVMQLNIKAFISSINKSENIFKFDVDTFEKSKYRYYYVPVKDRFLCMHLRWEVKAYDTTRYKIHTIKFGKYPINVDHKNNNYLENKYENGSLQKTGKKYRGYDEYIYQGQKYVRCMDMTCPFWVKVEPITWYIRNWDDLPRSINPRGTGKAKTIEVQSVEAIIPWIPYYSAYRGTEFVPDNTWKNSNVRGYLNGIDVKSPDKNTNFKKDNFLKDAFDFDPSLEKTKSNN